MPFGWFQVCWPDEVGVGEVKPLYYFGRHLVAWRDEEGDPHVWDAFCPHLGSHLGHGGKVEGCTIACPLHSWVFDADGHNIDVPYSDRINKKAKIRTYPVVERNGALLAWYHPTDAPPQWEVPEIPELSGDPEFGKVYRKHYKVKTHWQEVAETTADAAHIQQHLVRFEKELNGGEAGPIRMPDVDSYDTGFPNAHMRISQKFPTPRGMLEGRIDTDSYGPGLSATWFKGLVDTLALGCAVPVDEESCELRMSFAVRDLGDTALTESVAEAFVEGIHEQTVEDVPIWENKAYVPHPALSNADGPIMKFRKWAAQFYAEGVEDEKAFYEPAAPA
jgi:phenylpropionate dioxygenase-like ring-hydroxylating dioxygenase large terminal subunit